MTRKKTSEKRSIRSGGGGREGIWKEREVEKEVEKERKKRDGERGRTIEGGKERGR